MSLSNVVIPATVINNYLWDIMKQVEPSFVTIYGNTVPFFPLGDSASGDSSWTDKTYVLYDRMLRVSREIILFTLLRAQILLPCNGQQQSNIF